jgi:hypothetical protein
LVRERFLFPFCPNQEKFFANSLKIAAWQWSALYFFHPALQSQLDDFAKERDDKKD